MASFSRIAGRLAQKQRMEQRMGEYMLGRDVEGEKQDIREGRSQYASDVAAYERSAMRTQRKKKKRGLLGTLLGIGLNFVPGIGPMASVAGKPILTALAKAAPGMIGGAVGGYAASKQKMPSYQSNVYVEPGKFQKQARTDLSRDISDTMQFISASNEGQSLLDWTDALNSGLLIQQFGNIFGDSEYNQFAGYGRRNTGGSTPVSFRDTPGYEHITGRPGRGSTGYGG